MAHPLDRAPLGLIALLAWLVPGHARERFEREWHAELSYRAAWLEQRGALNWQARAGLLARAFGAVIHAFWLLLDHLTMDLFIRDVRHAWRALWHQPAFTLVAAVTLALGVGLNTAMIAIVDGVLLKPLPFHEPERLVELWESNPLRNWTHASIAPANLVDWQQRTTSFDALAWYLGSDTKQPAGVTLNLATDAGSQRVSGMYVSGNFFDVLGVKPALGRLFSDTERRLEDPPVILISDGLWQRLFGRDPAIVGRRVRVDAVSRTVIGVMPPSFAFGARPADYWLSTFVVTPEFRQTRVPHYLGAVARLKPGVTLAQAQADLSRVASQLEREYPDSNTQMGAGVGPLQEWYIGDMRRPLFIFLGAVSLVLLIACANVAALLLTRAADRTREMAVRAALGAGRLRLLRQQLTESLLLAILGGAGGLLVAMWAIQAFVALSPEGVPRLDTIQIDGRVLAAMMALTTATTLLCGAAPSIQAARVGVAGALRSGGRGSVGVRSGVFARRLIVIGEVALAVVLVVGAGLLARSFAALIRVSPGINPAGVVMARVSLPRRVYDTDEKVHRFFERALAGIRGMPGVEAAGGSSRLALEGYRWTGDLSVEGQPDVWGRELRHKQVTPGYFRAIGLPLLAGRDVSDADVMGKPEVAVINETLARQFFRAVDPVGKRIAYQKPTEKPSWVTVIGIVADEKQDGLNLPVQPEVYESHFQNPSEDMRLVVRTSQDGQVIAGSLRDLIRRLDPGLAFDVEQVSSLVNRSVARERFAALLISLFAAMALLLAGIGVYGVLAMVVGQRQHEIGLRMALGAQRRDIVGLLLGEGGRLVGTGLALGVFVALAARQALAGLLFGISASDPLTFAAVGVVLVVVGALACLVPARRALAVDPMETLRSE
jgi:putative ABC transport system permease protein